MRGIDSFKVLSGLGQNMDKTVVISSHDSLTCLRRRVRMSPWPQLAVRDRYTCLGIPVGKLTLNGVYEGARLLDKMEARCAAWSRAFSVLITAGRTSCTTTCSKGFPTTTNKSSPTSR